MQFKLIVAFVEDRKTDEIMHAAREAGATGCTVTVSYTHLTLPTKESRCRARRAREQ